MIESPTPQQNSQPVKERCPIDGHAVFFFVAAGIAYKCRHCKQEHVVEWAEILKRYTELVKGEAWDSSSESMSKSK